MKPSDYITVPKFAELKGIKKQWVYNLIKQGRFNMTKEYGNILIINDDLAKSYQKVKK